MKLKEARAYRHKVEQVAETQTDEQALQSIDLFPKWVEGKDAEKDVRWQYDGVLYKCVQAHRTQSDWTPDKTPALWVKVSLESGSEEQSIPFAQGMILENGKYYTQDDVRYLCIRDSIIGIYADLKHLVGNYVQLA